MISELSNSEVCSLLFLPIDGSTQFGTVWGHALPLAGFHPLPDQSGEVQGPQLSTHMTWPHGTPIHVNFVLMYNGRVAKAGTRSFFTFGPNWPPDACK